jgi:hypothetical protein
MAGDVNIVRKKRDSRKKKRLWTLNNTSSAWKRDRQHEGGGGQCGDLLETLRLLPGKSIPDDELLDMYSLSGCER